MRTTPGLETDSGEAEARRRRQKKIAFAIGLAVLVAVTTGMLRPHRSAFGFPPILVLLAIFFVVWRLLRSARERERLSQPVVTAPARILDVQDTGVDVSDKRVVVLVLEVMPPGRASYPARAQALMPHSELRRHVAGTMLEVRYNPATPHQVTVAGPAQPARRTAAQVAQTPQPEPDEIAATETFNQQLKTKGTLARANILEVRETGLKRDEGPFLKFRLEVRPIGSAPFAAEAAAVIRAASISAYEPGDEVWVKYDLGQRGRVALFNA